MFIIDCGDIMLEKDIELLMICLSEYIKDIDGEQFKKLFLGYVEYMARNYGQDCLIDEYGEMMIKVKQFVTNHNLDLDSLTPYKRNVLYHWIRDDYDRQDILNLYYFDEKVNALECFIDTINEKYQ